MLAKIWIGKMLSDGPGIYAQLFATFTRKGSGALQYTRMILFPPKSLWNENIILSEDQAHISKIESLFLKII